MRPVSPDQLRAVRRLRCPRCLQGVVFNGIISMHTNCPVCGLLYNREQGFFLGALYIAEMDRLFTTYQSLLPRMADWARERYPKDPDDPDFVYKQTVKAKA